MQSLAKYKLLFFDFAFRPSYLHNDSYRPTSARRLSKTMMPRGRSDLLVFAAHSLPSPVGA
jgi:hypothetical protein